MGKLFWSPRGRLAMAGLGVAVWAAPARSDLAVTASARTRVEAMSSVVVDADGHTFKLTPGLFGSARAGAKWTGWKQRVAIEIEGEVDGHWRDENSVVIEHAPYATDYTLRARRANVRWSATPTLHAQGGVNMAQWGMGLVSGAADLDRDTWSGTFADPDGGDNVLRGQFIVGPHTDYAIRGVATFDHVLADDVTLEGDSAQSVSGAIVASGEKRKEAWQLGGYVAHRWQSTDANNETATWVFNLAGKVEYKLCCGKAKAEFELVHVRGRSEFAPNIYFPSQAVRQWGAAGRVGWHGGKLIGATWGYVLDVVYASGDDNPYDDEQHALRADRNFSLGLILFRNVVAAQTGRSQVTASNPELSGYPATGVERLPSRGGVTNALAAFPRVVMQKGTFEAYGGALVALAPDRPTDPFNTRIAGDVARNALGGVGGSLWGVEVDVGARYEPKVGPVTLRLGTEVGVLVPGSALRAADGQRMDAVWAARVLAGVKY